MPFEAEERRRLFNLATIMTFKMFKIQGEACPFDVDFETIPVLPPLCQDHPSTGGLRTVDKSRRRARLSSCRLAIDSEK